MDKYQFNYLVPKERRKGHSYDKTKIFWVKCGQKQNVYDIIQSARADTEIYPTLEKYGCLDRMTLNDTQVYADYVEMMDMRDIFDQKKRAEEIWYNIPIEERKQFGDNMSEFVKRGGDWLKSRIEKAIEKTIKENTQSTEEIKESEVTNG